MSVVFAEHGTSCDDFIVAPGPQGAVGHDMGSGPIEAGVPIVIDIWPRDNTSCVYCDMTRTFVVGDVPDDVRDVAPALQGGARPCRSPRSRAARAGRTIFDGTCEIFEAAGEQTQRTKEDGVPLVDGFFHGLGHGVGLEVHEEPGLGLIAESPLRAGDVVTVEPGLYRAGYGGVRLEDLVLVTDTTAPRTSRTTRTTWRRRRVMTTEQTIDTLFLEERRYPPPAEFAAQANAKPEIYDEDFEAFWEREARSASRGSSRSRRSTSGSRRTRSGSSAAS